MLPNKEAIQAAAKEISSHAIILYNLMKPGTTLDIVLHEEKQIVTPNQTQEAKHLLITKPEICANIHVRPHANSN